MPKRNIIVIGASAGGVEALCEFNQNLPKDLGATVRAILPVSSVLSAMLFRRKSSSEQHTEALARAHWLIRYTRSVFRGYLALLKRRSRKPGWPP